MARIVVIGGSGYLGSRVVTALRRAGADVQVASRRGPVVVDSSRPETFAALAPFEVVVDVTDTVTSPPDALVAWCLAQGKTVLEATSDAPCVERLAAAHRHTTGRLVLGGGLFTGLSNLLARDVARRVGTPEQLTLGIASSPFSGAGTGTVALMVGAMNVPAVRYANGERLEVAGLTRGPTLDFAGQPRPSVRMSLAEPPMLRASTGAQRVDAFFAPKPSLLVAAFTALPAWLLRQGWYRALLGGYFSVLRRLVLRSRVTAVELLAQARRGGESVTRFLRAPDGMTAGGVALAAMAEALATAPGPAGLRYIDDACELEPLVARINALAGETMVALRPPEVVRAPALDAGAASPHGAVDEARVAAQAGGHQ